jgi:hypothetical protein
VSPQMVALSEDRLAYWHLLREMAGQRTAGAA